MLHPTRSSRCSNEYYGSLDKLVFLELVSYGQNTQRTVHDGAVSWHSELNSGVASIRLHLRRLSA
eukprot:6155911-Pyramimonas_sp.AAC.1